MQGTLPIAGSLVARKISGAQRAPLSWRIRNALRPSYVLGWLEHLAAYLFSALTGIPTIVGELRAILIHPDGRRIDYGVVAWRKITQTGVGLLVDDWQAGTPRLNTMNYHGCGTGAVAEANTDTALGTESTTALNPDSTRATGTATQPSANVFQSVGTLTFDAGAAITEHGLLSQAATGGGVLWDRSVFAAINVVSADSIQFTYQCTVNYEA